MVETVEPRHPLLRSFPPAVVVCVLCGMFVVNVTAAVDVPQQQQQEDQTKPDPQATEKKSHQVEQGLPWKDLEDSSNHPKFGTDQPPDAQVNRIERAIRGMREAGRRLSQSDASQATRDVQRQVLRDLDELIRSARQQRMSQQQQQRDNSTPRQQPQRRPKGEQQEQRPASDASAPATRPQQTKDKTLESEERLTKSANERAKLANRRRLAAEVWGHLPDRVRERLLQHYDVNYLPRYEELVRRYFEALAETNNRQNSR